MTTAKIKKKEKPSVTVNNWVLLVGSKNGELQAFERANFKEICQLAREKKVGAEYWNIIKGKSHYNSHYNANLPLFKEDKEQVRDRVPKRYSIEEVHALFDSWQEQYGDMKLRQNKRIFDTFDGYVVKTFSQRYDVFKRSLKCAHCGLEANCYMLERQIGAKAYHFNLYYVDDEKEILFTKDHILPKAKGGKDHMSNYQTMCYPCNQEKADIIKE